MHKFKYALVAALGYCLGAQAEVLPFANADFEQAKADGRAVGWVVMQHAGPDAYDFRTDDQRPFRGKLSLRGTRTAENAYGLVQQHIPATGLIGKRLRLTAHVRTKDVGPEGVLLLLSFRAGDTFVDQVKSAPIAGTRRWQKITLAASVPEKAQSIVIGAMLMDGGSFWLDEIRVESD